MPSTYSPTLRIELIGAGEQDGTWGTTTNTNLGTLIEQAITGVVAITMVDANYTLTSFNGIPDESRNAVLVLGGTNTAQRNLITPAVEKAYTVKNTTGATVVVTTGSGDTVSVLNGETKQVFCDGTNFYESLVVSGTGTGSIVYSNSPTLTGTPLAPTAAVSTDNTQIATTAFVRDIIPTGIISMWSGSIATIPSGWFLCDGSNGTPDLRDRFVVGAGSTYAVAATGGSANAIVVSHTHTASSSVSDPGHAHGYNDPVAGGGLSAYNSGFQVAGGTTAAAGTGISVSTSIGTTGSSGTNANLPPYYALAYIMKA